MPEIVMPELHSVNISHDFDFPELNFTEFELAADMPPMDIELEPEPEIEPEPEAEPAPEPESSYDVRIYQQDNFIITEAAGEPIAALPVSSDAAGLFKAAINATPDGGSLHIGAGHYNLSAPYSFALNPDGSNIFYSAIQILDKDMVMSGDGGGLLQRSVQLLAEAVEITVQRPGQPVAGRFQGHAARRIRVMAEGEQNRVAQLYAESRPPLRLLRGVQREGGADCATVPRRLDQGRALAGFETA